MGRALAEGVGRGAGPELLGTMTLIGVGASEEVDGVEAPGLRSGKSLTYTTSGKRSINWSDLLPVRFLRSSVVGFGDASGSRRAADGSSGMFATFGGNTLICGGDDSQSDSSDSFGFTAPGERRGVATGSFSTATERDCLGISRAGMGLAAAEEAAEVAAEVTADVTADATEAVRGAGSSDDSKGEVAQRSCGEPMGEIPFRRGDFLARGVFASKAGENVRVSVGQVPVMLGSQVRCCSFTTAAAAAAVAAVASGVGSPRGVPCLTSTSRIQAITRLRVGPRSSASRS